MRLNEIKERLDSIAVEMRSEGADLDALEKETDELLEERSHIEAEADKRAALEAKVLKSNNIIKEAPIMESVKNYAIDSEEYRNAWLKELKGEELTIEERDAMTSATTSAGYAIPSITANKIITNLEKIAPMIAYADIMHVPGNLVIPVEGTVNGAAEHSEAAAMTPASDTLTRIELGAHEICKMVEISAKVRAMAVPAFEAWLAEQLARKLAEEIDNRMINGDGGTTVQSYGINSAETWVSSGAGQNAVDWASTAPTVAELLTAIGLIPAAYSANAKMIMNHKTFWTRVFGLRDDKTPAVVMGADGKYRVFGFEVIVDNKVGDDVIFMGDPYEGLKGNFAEDVRVEVHDNFSHWSKEYRGTCLFDCKALPKRWVKCAATV